MKIFFPKHLKKIIDFIPDSILGYHFQNGVLRVADAENSLICAHFCLTENEQNEQNCRSFNFIEDPAIGVQNCELMSMRATLIPNHASLVPRNRVLYFEKIREGEAKYIIYRFSDCFAFLNV